MTHSDMFELEAFKKLFSSYFDSKNLDHAKKILGIKMIRDISKHVSYLSQRRYIKNVLQYFSSVGIKMICHTVSKT